jgi:hypothetical protein
VRITLYGYEHRTLSIYSFDSNAPGIHAAIHEIRNDLLRHFDAHCIQFPTADNKSPVEVIPAGWGETTECLFYGFKMCSFMLHYRNVLGKREYFVVDIPLSTVENPTFSTVVEKLKQIIVKDETSDDTVVETSDYRLKNFRKAFRVEEDPDVCYPKKCLKEFDIVELASKRDRFVENRRDIMFVLEDTVFSRDYKTFHDSLYFDAKIIAV